MKDLHAGEAQNSADVRAGGIETAASPRKRSEHVTRTGHAATGVVAVGDDQDISPGAIEGKVADVTSRVSTSSGPGLFIVLISIHGLIRGEDPELGRDADTGGQVQYVLDLTRALADHPDVDRVELLTRQILSTNVDPEYGDHLEQLSDKAWIVRLPCGPHRYLRKESLWRYLPQFVDNALLHFREVGRVPDLVHGHYADGGVVGLRLGTLLGAPVVYTGHSLGRVKKHRLIENGVHPETIEKRHKISRRIQAEEGVIRGADLIVASTEQEVSDQYGLYSSRLGKKAVVIPPGIDLERFRPPQRGEEYEIASEIDRFLHEPGKPLILAVQRPDERKNLAGLLRAYGECDPLRDTANLALMIGTRDDISKLGGTQRGVLTEMLLAIDRFDLYGSVAYPKSHTPADIAELYRLAASRRGVFASPAVTEPFGLTLLEAAASGLPVVATDDRGPRETIKLCKNGVLVDALDAKAISDGLLEVLRDRRSWRRRARAGVRGAVAHFSWQGHVNKYLRQARRLLNRRRNRAARPPARMALAERLIVCNIDDTLTGDGAALEDFLSWLEEHRQTVAFGVATGRVLQRTLKVLKEWSVPLPDVLITSVGSEVFYGRERPVEDGEWRRAIDNAWDPSGIRECLRGLPGLRLQPKNDQRPFKISYFVDPDAWMGTRQIRNRLKNHGLRASIVYSHEKFLDLLPTRASKGRAVKYLSERWGFAPDRVLVAGNSGNDAAMLKGVGQGVVVGNHSPELRSLRGRDGIYFARAKCARGVLEGIEHFSFLRPEGVAENSSTKSKGESE